MTPQQQPEQAPADKEPIFNLAWIVVVLIAACVAIHFTRTILLSPQQDFEFLLRTAFIPIRYSGGYPIDVFALSSPLTYSLLHADLLHLAINMIWLAAFGSPLANRVGVHRFVVFWIFTSLSAVFLHYLLHADDPAMVIGASGAVSGAMGAAARFGFKVDRSAPKAAFAGTRLPLAGVIRQRNVVVFLTVWFAINLIAGMGYLVPGETAPIAWEAHIGGFAAGFFGVGVFDRRLR